MHDDKKHLVEMIQKFNTAILVTQTIRGDLHGRPMELAKVEESGDIFFATSLNSPKFSEIIAESKVGVFFQDAKYYVSLYGTAEPLRDKALIDELWQESWKVWFPEGKESSDICIIRVRPTSGEYWDRSGAKGVRFLFEAFKAYAAGEKLGSGEGHAKVAMG